MYVPCTLLCKCIYVKSLNFKRIHNLAGLTKWLYIQPQYIRRF